MTEIEFYPNLFHDPGHRRGFNFASSTGIDGKPGSQTVSECLKGLFKKDGWIIYPFRKI